MSKHAPSPLDPRARAVVERLHAQSKREFRKVFLPMLATMATSRVRHGTWDAT